MAHITSKVHHLFEHIPQFGDFRSNIVAYLVGPESWTASSLGVPLHNGPAATLFCKLVDTSRELHNCRKQ